MRSFVKALIVAGTASAALCGSSAAAPCPGVSCAPLPDTSARLAVFSYLAATTDAPKPPSCESLAGSPRTGCAVLRGMAAEARRAAIYADMAKGWDRDRRVAFARLLTTEETFAKAVGDYETDGIGAEAGADAIVAEEAEKTAFVTTLQALVRGTTRVHFVDFAESDGALNAAYAQVMAVRDTSELPWGSVEKAGIRTTQRAWLAYRDAFVAFATDLDETAAEPLKAELTTRRTVSLEGFLGD